MNTLAPVVSIVDGKPVTTSLDIAKHFNKRHDTVLRAIKQLECSPEFNRRNFAAVIREYKNGKGGTQQAQAFQITRDGFVFLCMGFTGKEATKWKEAYIAAFNEMEAALMVEADLAPQPSFSLLNKRWLVYFDCNGVECAKLIPTEAAIIIPDEIQDLIANPSIVSERQLANIVQACATRLKAASDQRRREALHGGQ